MKKERVHDITYGAEASAAALFSPQAAQRRRFGGGLVSQQQILLWTIVDLLSAVDGWIDGVALPNLFVDR